MTGSGGGPLAGRWSLVRPVSPEDLGLLYKFYLEPDVSARIRIGGAVPSPDDFMRGAYDGVLGQWIVEGSASGAFLGHVVLASVNLSDGFGFLSIASNYSGDLRSVAFLDGVGVVLDYIFACWPLRMLYADVAEENLLQFASIVPRLFEVEGVRRQQRYILGRYQDVHLLVLTRERWLQVGVPLRRRLMRQG